MFKRPAAIPFFFTQSVIIPFKSKEAGHPVHEARDFVRFVTPGERDEQVLEVTDIHKKMYREQWADYREQREQIPTGTPLLHLFPGNPEIVDNLKSIKFHTIEQLAEANDVQIASIAMGGYDYQAKAKRFLEGTKDASRFAKLEKAIEDNAFRLLQLEEENAALKAEAASKKANKGAAA